MNGGSNNIAVLADRNPASQHTVQPEAELVLDNVDVGHDDDLAYEESVEPRSRGPLIAKLLAGLVIAAWAAGFVFAMLPLWQQTVPPPEAMLSQFVVFCVPVLLFVTLYALATRNGRVQSQQALSAVARLRSEQERLDTALARMATRIGDETTALTQTHDSLMTFGETATQRMKAASDAMLDEVATLTRYGNALKFSATSARADIAVLLSDLPKAQLETRQMVSALHEAGTTAHDRATALDTMMTSLKEHGRDADAIASGAAEKLASHMTRIESVGEAVRARLDDAASRMTGAFDVALNKAAEASDAARQTLDAQAEAMRALVDQAQAALQRTGGDAADAVGRHVDNVTHRIEALGALLDGQTQTTAALLESVRDGVQGLDTHFAALDDNGTERATRLAAALAKLDDHAVALTGSLATGTANADTMIDRTDRLMVALDAATREIDETLPAAFARLEDHSTRAQATVTATAPLVTKLESDAVTALTRLTEAEAIVAKHRESLAASHATAAALLATVQSADDTARGFAEGAGAQLIEAMVRVREAAQVASERARDAISAAIPESTAQLSASVREALTKAITEQVTAHLADLSTTAEHAVEAAGKASDTLMRHMLTISETSASVEARIVESRTAIEANDRDNFARRVALLIESLNSTSIDVAKVLASDITDVAWAAYLRGDRGIFTRRAVRLLDAGEAREVLRQYESDPEFREQINRYVHDFEAILRNVLATRDGSSLGVALLSSDMGKLYVALAQAIERLRS